MSFLLLAQILIGAVALYFLKDIRDALRRWDERSSMLDNLIEDGEARENERLFNRFPQYARDATDAQGEKLLKRERFLRLLGESYPIRERLCEYFQKVLDPDRFLELSEEEKISVANDHIDALQKLRNKYDNRLAHFVEAASRQLEDWEHAFPKTPGSAPSRPGLN